MEEIITCNICAQQFDHIYFIPKMLECGHTFCTSCLNKVFLKKPCCPNCRAVIKGIESSLTTNYTTLKVVDIYKSKRLSEREIVTSIDVMKEKCMEKRDILSRKKTRITSSIEVFEECLAKLEELTMSESHRVDTASAKKILNELREKLKQTDHVMCSDDIKSSISIRLSSFEDSEEYLTEIYKRVQNKEKVFSVHKIMDEIKYGEISSYEDKLFFHSLTSSEAPKESSLIWFEDLKLCLNDGNFNTFIKICCNEKGVTRMVIIDLWDRHSCNQFIKLCTGECGPSYKGSSYKKGSNVNMCDDLTSVLHVEKIIENGCETKRLVDYKYCGGEKREEVTFHENVMYLYLNSNGSFDIVCSFEKLVIDFKLAYGNVISPFKLFEKIDYEDVSYLKVIDSGILFNL